ncbi:MULTISPECIES: hypothetical protein [unclassified Saccharopolyspora]|uniref:hypothetical protein n=1 Tax=unclassified Saccharopolyspora TaxID=2646250 RepID=UPI001CD24094|nr:MULTISPECIES: hypothetical protein [unclassified Saccharopolyspora]MCA1192119.1 hypothetical protein [Saccharopolyspora sp. 6V]MCA1229218.1 hypothetical protein [Saccharopolyspora sp. 6M]
MRINAKNVVVSGLVAGAVLVVGGGIAAAVNLEQVPSQVQNSHHAEPGHEGEGKYTAGDYRLHVRELTDDGEGFGTTVEPGTTYYSKTLHGSESWQPTVLKFSVGDEADGPIVFSYPIPEDGEGVDCVASGTEAEPTVECTTTPAG